MPNGGMLPCCRVCQFAQSSRSPDNILCVRHNIPILDAFHLFCPDLSNLDTPGLAQFVQSNELEHNFIYAWTVVQYRAKNNPTIPQYQHQFIPLASILSYTNWTDAERQAAIQIQQKAHKETFGVRFGASFWQRLITYIQKRRDHL